VIEKSDGGLEAFGGEVQDLLEVGVGAVAGGEPVDGEAVDAGGAGLADVAGDHAGIVGMIHPVPRLIAVRRAAGGPGPRIIPGEIVGQDHRGDRRVDPRSSRGGRPGGRGSGGWARRGRGPGRSGGARRLRWAGGAGRARGGRGTRKGWRGRIRPRRRRRRRRRNGRRGDRRRFSVERERRGRRSGRRARGSPLAEGERWKTTRQKDQDQRPPQASAHGRSLRIQSRHARRISARGRPSGLGELYPGESGEKQGPSKEDPARRLAAGHRCEENGKR